MPNFDEHINNLDEIIKDREQINKDVTIIITTGYDKIIHNMEFQNTLMLTAIGVCFISLICIYVLLIRHYWR